MMIGVLEEARVHFHHPRVEALLVCRQSVPRGDVRIGDDSRVFGGRMCRFFCC